MCLTTDAKETGVAVELSSVPSLTLLTQIKTREGEKIEVIKAVAPRWKDVGCLLDFDAIGKTLQQIQADNGHEGVESCCRVMFQHWLEGNGVQPVTWATLLEILEDCFFTKLAERIKASLTYEFQCECMCMYAELNTHTHSHTTVTLTAHVPRVTLIHNL